MPQRSSCLTPRRLAGGLFLALLVVLIPGVLACGSAHPRLGVRYDALAAAEAPGPAVAPERVHALLINGGGTPEINFASHLAHIRGLASMLTRAGVAPERISILSSDGDAPAPDLAVREPDPESFWLLAGTATGRALRAPTRFESSTVPGFALQPATVRGLWSWFDEVGSRLRDGDTLLLYVTDHGMGDRNDVLETRIVLWGKDTSITVRDLRRHLRTLRPGVRVVALMSQCFSGGFAWLSHNDGEVIPQPNVCGYFSSRYDMMAHGCYAELAAGELGHSFTFLWALEHTGDFGAAHRAALVADNTPDVPLRTSDLWLQQLLSDMAIAARVPVIKLVDSLLEQAWENPDAWERDIRTIDEIGRVYGFMSPRSVREVQILASQLSRVKRRIGASADAWSTATAGAAQANLDDFLEATPAWAPRLEPAALAALAAPERRTLTEELLRDLGGFTSRGDEAASSMQSFADLADKGDSLTFRTEVRIAALLRMGALLTSIAGRVYLASEADPALLEAYRAMRACEGFSLEGLRAPDAAGPARKPPPPLPPLVDDLRIVDEVMPASTGLMARSLNAALVEQLKLPRGAAKVERVAPRSPAAAARLAPGDVILGPPGKPFARPGEFLPWLLQLEAGKPQPLIVQRKSKAYTVTITPEPARIEWSGLGTPPSLGERAPPVEGTLYRGARPAGPHLLFFWATWCKPCKAAVPGLLEYAQRRRLPVVAVTDEGRATLDEFFAQWDDPFPDIVVSDEVRRSFLSYGISGTPTFVLIDGAGRVRGHQVGYDSEDRLKFPTGG